MVIITMLSHVPHLLTLVRQCKKRKKKKACFGAAEDLKQRQTSLLMCPREFLIAIKPCIWSNKGIFYTLKISV